MPLKLNTAVFHRALGAAHAGHVDHGDWEAPAGADRTVDNSVGHDPDGTPAEMFEYPIMAGGKVSAKGVASAMAFAKKNNESAIVPALQKIDDALKGDDAKTLSRALETVGAFADRLYDLSPDDAAAMELSRAPRLARCPNGLCNSHDVERRAGGEHEGPTDRCKQCGRQWPHKPGSLTAEQFAGGDTEEPDDEQLDEVPPMAGMYGDGLESELAKR